MKQKDDFNSLLLATNTTFSGAKFTHVAQWCIARYIQRLSSLQRHPFYSIYKLLIFSDTDTDGHFSVNNQALKE